MGGALAELFTLDLIEGGVKPENIVTYGFASPLVGDRRLQEYAKSLGASERIHKLVHKRDVFGNIGYGLLWGNSLAADNNIFDFGNSGVFDMNHHSLPKIYLPFIASQNDQPRQKQFEAALVVADM